MQRIGYRTPDDVPEPDQPRARRVRLWRARCHHHPQPAACRQRDHDRTGGAADRDPRDDCGPCLRARRHHHRRRRPGLLRRRRPAAAQGHDEGRVAAPAPGLRSRALHPAPVEPADHRRRPRHGVRRRLRDRHQHRLHHRVRRCRLRPAGGDGRPERRRRVAGLPSAGPPARESHADADDGRADHRAGGAPARDGQRTPPQRPN